MTTTTEATSAPALPLAEALDVADLERSILPLGDRRAPPGEPRFRQGHDAARLR